MKHNQIVWSWVGIFIIALVISLPFESAQTLAATVSITKNQGQKGIDGFIDANGDTWTVEATLTGTQNNTVDPKDVKIKVGEHETEFNSCSDSGVGVTCQYVSPLNDGVREQTYGFTVFYNFLNALGIMEDGGSDASNINADGSAPVIVLQDAHQESDGKFTFIFNVEDKSGSASPSGIKKIQVINSENGNVIWSKEDFAIGIATFNYPEQAENIINLSAILFGDGYRTLKILAEDQLGHVAISPPTNNFYADLIAPEIKDDMNLTELGEYIGPYQVTTGITIGILEKNLDQNQVIASSEQADLQNTPADRCKSNADNPDLYLCSWNNVLISSGNTISIKFMVKDNYGNVAEKTLTKDFTSDDTAPKIEYFGAEGVFEDISYVKSGYQKIILKAKDEGGSILSEEHIKANLNSLGGSENFPQPVCNLTLTPVVCSWETSKLFTADGEVRIGLTQLRDKVGNEGPTPEVIVKVDTTAPKLVPRKMEIYGVSGSGEEKNYLQSNDRIKIKFVAEENSGLVVLLNLNDWVMDAATLYPSNDLTYHERNKGAGWVAFKAEDVCERNENGQWACEVETDKIKSGPEDLELELKILDTAGNNVETWPEIENGKLIHAREGKYRFSLLGLDTETNPDYWEVNSANPMGGDNAFVDLDVTPLTYTRMPFQVALKTSNSKVRALNVELMDCVSPEENNAPVVSTPTEAEQAPVSDREQLTASQTPPLTGQAALTENTEIGPALTPTVPEISRSLMYGGNTPDGDTSPKPTLILEFSPFNGREMFALSEDNQLSHDVEYDCKLKIYSRVGDNALESAELQDVTIKVPFGFSQLGANDENLDQLIQKARDDANGAWKVIGILGQIIKWLDYLASAVSLVMGAISLVNKVSTLTESSLRKIPTGGVAGAISFCLGVKGTENGLDKGIFQTINQILGVLSCSNTQGLGWYSDWTNFIVKYYNELMNIEVGSGVDFSFAGTDPGVARQEGLTKGSFKPARSIKDNLYLSIAGLCIPGIIKNLDKYRQIKCRKIVCLENDVKAGLATVSSCDELEGLLTCKYFIGELWYILPFSQFYDKVINMLWNMFKDPIALTHTATIAVCSIQCAVNEGLSEACSYLYYIWDVIDYLENVVGTITSIVNDVKQGGLQYCDQVL